MVAMKPTPTRAKPAIKPDSTDKQITSITKISIQFITPCLSGRGTLHDTFRWCAESRQLVTEEPVAVCSSVWIPGNRAHTVYRRTLADHPAGNFRAAKIVRNP